jgi:LysM repeat protein
MNQQVQRASRIVRAAALIAGIAALLASAAGSPPDTWRAFVAAIESSSATPDFDQLLANSAAVAAWVGLGWLVIAVVFELASVLPGAVGRGCAAIAARTTPMLVRRIVQAAIGVSVLAGPLTAGSAFAAGPSGGASTSTTTTSASSTPATPSPSAGSPAIQLDRPNSLAAPALQGTSPALALDRPATPFVASPPQTPKWTSTGPAALVTGVVHREATNPADATSHGYVVRRGDTLWDIAARHLGPNATSVDISRAWPAWYAANRAVIGADPSVIRPGELLLAPSGSTSHAGTR